jgi:hypothetical protein
MGGVNVALAMPTINSPHHASTPVRSWDTESGIPGQRSGNQRLKQSSTDGWGVTVERPRREHFTLISHNLVNGVR